MACEHTHSNQIEESSRPDDLVEVVAPKFIEHSIISEQRLALTKAYVKKHYGVSSPFMAPSGIVIHYTTVNDLGMTLRIFDQDSINSGRTYVAQFGVLNVGVHYVVDQNGDIYRLMPDTVIGRHTIGFNYGTLAIENVARDTSDLTPEQLQANIELVTYLKHAHPSIKYLYGHHEYMIDSLPHFSTYLELDTTYAPTIKKDPGPAFMSALRNGLQTKEIELLP